MNVSALRSGIYAKPEQSACFRTTEYIKALTEDSETTVSVQKLVGGGVQDVEDEYNSIDEKVSSKQPNLCE